MDIVILGRDSVSEIITLKAGYNLFNIRVELQDNLKDEWYLVNEQTKTIVQEHRMNDEQFTLVLSFIILFGLTVKTDRWDTVVSDYLDTFGLASFLLICAGLSSYLLGR